jgi:hypothetical protein
MTLLSATKFARECFDRQARANRWLSASARELYSPFRDFIPIGLATSYDVHESLGGSASISFGVVQYVVVAFRKREVDLPKEPRLDTRRGDRRGNGRGAQSSFYRGADRFIGRQLERDAEVARRKAESLKGMFKTRTGAGARLAQHPVDVQEIFFG